MKKFGIFTNIDKDKEGKITEKLERILNEKNLISYKIQSDNIEEYTDCIIVIGGDGTLLTAARKFLDKNIPFLGINMGTLGFLIEVSIDNMENAIHHIVEGDYFLQDRMLLEGELIGKDGKYIKTYALNDIVLTKEVNSIIIRYKLAVNDKTLYTYSGDGIIVSTPTGSTGYSLSAGGPIVKPTAELFVVTPICAHSLVARSVILSSSDKIEIEIVKFRENIDPMGNIVSDGVIIDRIEFGEKLRISKSSKKIKLLKIDEESFLENIRRKMNI